MAKTTLADNWDNEEFVKLSNQLEEQLCNAWIHLCGFMMEIHYRGYASAADAYQKRMRRGYGLDTLKNKISQLERNIILTVGGPASEICSVTYDSNCAKAGCAHELALRWMTVFTNECKLMVFDSDRHEYDAIIEKVRNLTAAHETVLVMLKRERMLIERHEPKMPDDFFELSVDEVRGEVKRKGYQSTVHLSPGSAQLHTFLVAFYANEKGATKSDWEKDYPGKRKPDNMRSVKRNVNEKIEILNLRLAAEIPPKLEEIR